MRELICFIHASTGARVTIAQTLAAYTRSFCFHPVLLASRSFAVGKRRMGQCFYFERALYGVSLSFPKQALAGAAGAFGDEASSTCIDNMRRVL